MLQVFVRRYDAALRLLDKADAVLHISHAAGRKVTASALPCRTHQTVLDATTAEYRGLCAQVRSSFFAQLALIHADLTMPRHRSSITGLAHWWNAAPDLTAAWTRLALQIIRPLWVGIRTPAC